MNEDTIGDMFVMMFAWFFASYVLPRKGPKGYREKFESKTSQYVEKLVQRHTKNTAWIREKIGPNHPINDDDLLTMVRNAVGLGLEVQNAAIFLFIPVIFAVFPISSSLTLGPNPAYWQELVLCAVIAAILAAFVRFFRFAAIRIRVGQLVNDRQQ